MTEIWFHREKVVGPFGWVRVIHWKGWLLCCVFALVVVGWLAVSLATGLIVSHPTVFVVVLLALTIGTNVVAWRHTDGTVLS